MVVYSNSQNFSQARGIYVLTMLDVPGVVAANNFFSVMNPAASGIRHEVVDLRIGCYSVGSSGTPNSIAGYRISGHSGGTLYDASSIERFITAMPNPLTEIRTAGPAVTSLGVTPLFFKTPMISTGAGGTSSDDLPIPQGGSFPALQGQGFVMRTAAGNSNQMWDFSYTWAEYQL